MPHDFNFRWRLVLRIDCRCLVGKIRRGNRLTVTLEDHLGLGPKTVLRRCGSGRRARGEGVTIDSIEDRSPLSGQETNGTIRRNTGVGRDAAGLIDGKAHQGCVALGRIDLSGIGDTAAGLHFDDQAAKGRITTGLLKVDLVGCRHHHDLAIRRVQGARIFDIGCRGDDSTVGCCIDLRPFKKLNRNLLLVSVGIQDEVTIRILLVDFALAHESGASILPQDLSDTAL